MLNILTSIQYAPTQLRSKMLRRGGRFYLNSGNLFNDEVDFYIEEAIHYKIDIFQICLGVEPLETIVKAYRD